MDKETIKKQGVDICIKQIQYINFGLKQSEDTNYLVTVITIVNRLMEMLPEISIKDRQNLIPILAKIEIASSKGTYSKLGNNDYPQESGGSKGEPGRDGATPTIGYNGNWFIRDIDTGVQAIGKDGKDGKDGRDGVTPNIGYNNNWFIDGIDTGIPAIGKDGESLEGDYEGKYKWEYNEETNSLNLVYIG